MSRYSVSVLVVDDERFFREAIEEILCSAGIVCVTAETGEQALEMAADTAIGVVVLDVRLPDIDGIRVLERLLAMRPSLHVIMLSASTDQELVLDALRLGACDYLAKPLHDEELLLATRRALDNYEVSTHWVGLRCRLERLVSQVAGLSERVRGQDGEQRERVLARGAVEAAADVLEANRTSLMRVDDEGLQLRVVAVVGHKLVPEEIEGVDIGEGIAGRVLASDQPMLVSDISEQASGFATDHSDRYGSSSFMLAPLRVGGRPLGVLCVTERADGGAFDDQDLALFRLLAMQLRELMAPVPAADTELRREAPSGAEAALVSQAAAAPLLSEAKPESDEVFDSDAELARCVCQAMIDEVEPDRVVGAALRSLAGLLPAAPVSLFLLDTESGEFAREWECDAGVEGDRERLGAGLGLCGMAAQTGYLVASDDPGTDPRFDPEVDTALRGQAGPLLCLPLRLRGKVVGLFRAFPRNGGAASPRTAEVLATVLSALLRSVLLYRSLLESIEEVAEARRATAIR